MEKLKAHFTYYVLYAFFAFSLFNPWLKKYDYGAGFPLIILFSVILIAIFLVEFLKKRENSFFDKFFLLIFGVTYVVSFYFSQTKNLSLPETLAYLAVIPVYLMFAHQKLNWEMRMYKFFNGLAISSVLFGYFQFFFLDSTRMTGPFMNILYHSNFWPNAFGMFLLLIWPIMLINNIGKKLKIIHYLLFSFVISGLLLTFSRGAFLSFMGQIALLAIFFRKDLNFRKIVNYGLVFVLSLFLFYSANYVRSLSHNVINVSQRIAFENNELVTSYQERSDFMKGALALSMERPLTGFGPFSFRNIYNPMQKVFLGSSDHPHNMFLKYAVENGYINLIAFLLFLLTIFITILRRFSKLVDFRKKRVLLLSVSLLGMFAHNMIDYNLNFFASLLLFFIILAFLRSNLVNEDDLKPRKSVLSLIFIVFVFLVSSFEVFMIVAPKVGFSGNFLDYRLYPRYEYLTNADDALKNSNFDFAVENLEKELELNPIDSQAYYLMGVIYCNENFINFDLVECKNYYEKALKLNPKNNIDYYREYLNVMIKMGMGMDDLEFKNHFDVCATLFNDYVTYVKYNVHFTSYTTMVNSAADMIDLMMPYFDESAVEKLEEKKANMLRYAKEHLGNKIASTF